MSKKIAILSAHFGKDRFGHALADAYQLGAERAGADIRRMDLQSLNFDPVLKAGNFDGDQPLEPDLIRFQETLSWCDHWSVIYPMWWGGLPAALQGLLDRALLPGFAFQFEQGKSLPKQLLKGRTARVLVTSDTPVWYYKWVYGAGNSKRIKSQILDFVGFQNRGIDMYGSVHDSKPHHREAWLKKARRSGDKDASLVA